MTPQYLVYGSGDPATALLRDHFFAKQIPIVFMDLRVHDVNGKPANLVFLLDKKLTTIPQVFTAEGVHVGDYEAARLIIDKAPAPKVASQSVA